MHISQYNRYSYRYSPKPQLFNQCPPAPKMTQNYRQRMRTNHFVQRPFYTYVPRQTVPTNQNRYIPKQEQLVILEFAGIVGKWDI